MTTNIGSCANGVYDPELWWPLSYAAASRPQIELAQLICHRCPIEIACLTGALGRPDHGGIWGGTTPDERKNNDASTLIRLAQLDKSPTGPEAPVRVG